MTRSTTKEKISVSVSPEQLRFLEAYRHHKGLGSRSEVIAHGIDALRREDLAAAYREHAAEWAESPERQFWDEAAVADGLDEEEV